MKAQTNSYKELTVWQKSMDLVGRVYALTESFPRKDYVQFLKIAFASGAELETQLEIVKRLVTTKHLNFRSVDATLDEVMKMLNAMIRSLNPSLTT